MRSNAQRAPAPRRRGPARSTPSRGCSTGIQRQPRHRRRLHRQARRRLPDARRPPQRRPHRLRHLRPRLGRLHRRQAAPAAPSAARSAPSRGYLEVALIREGVAPAAARRPPATWARAPLAEEVRDVQASRRRLAAAEAREDAEVTIEELLAEADAADAGPLRAASRELPTSATASRVTAAANVSARDPGASPSIPSSSVVVPVRNGADMIGDCIDVPARRRLPRRPPRDPGRRQRLHRRHRRGHPPPPGHLPARAPPRRLQRPQPRHRRGQGRGLRLHRRRLPRRPRLAHAS